MIHKICLLLIIGALSLCACGSSNDNNHREPQTDQAKLQATIDVLQATVDASAVQDVPQGGMDTPAVGIQTQPSSVTATSASTEAAPQSTAISKSTSPPTLSLAESLIGDWRVIGTYKDGRIITDWGEGVGPYEDGTIAFLAVLVFAADGRFLDAISETFGTYRIVEDERQLLLYDPELDWNSTWKIIDVSGDRLRLLNEDDPPEKVIDFVRYGAGSGAADQAVGLWHFQPNEFTFWEQEVFLGSIFLDNQGGFYVWGDRGAAIGGKYDRFTDDVLVLPGTPWEDEYNGPPILHIERLNGDKGHFSFPEVEIELGFDAIRVREDEELARRLNGNWLLLGEDGQYYRHYWK